MPIRLQELTPPFSEDYHELITTQLLPLHRELRPHLTSTTLSSPSTYLSLIQTICTLSHAHLLFAFSSSSTPSSPDSLVGFILYRTLYDTFNGHRLLISDFVVTSSHRNQGIGSLMLSYLHQLAVDRQVRFITAEVNTSLVRCPPLLARSGLIIQALSFICHDPSPTTSPSTLSTSIHTTLIDPSNLSSPSSQSLLTLLEPIYRQLRPFPYQFPSSTPSYLSTLHHVITHGAFLIIAHSLTGHDVMGVAACRWMGTVERGERLHVDDLVVDEGRRSTGVGRVLMERVKEEARGRGSGVPVTLESGTQRTDAHRFYWRERMVVEELYWRGEVKAK
jgi:GNAT superfamily N-acetyltransferase